MRLTFVISSLSSGGAERVMSTMANVWAARGCDIRIFTFDDGSTQPFYDLDSRVRHTPLGLRVNSSNPVSGLLNNLKRVRVLRRAISGEQPDAVISFMDRTNVLVLLATEGLGIPVLVSERIDPRISRYEKDGHFWGQLRRWTYPRASRVIVQTEAVRSFYEPQLGPDLLRVIPNPVRPVTGSSGVDLPDVSRPMVVAIGRMVQQKRYDILIDAFARLKDRHPDWHMTIFGDGPLRAQLEAQVQSLGLAARIHMPGRVKDTHAVLRHADLFAMSSDVEGFPNVLCEAMACGVPSLYTDCLSGPSEIIRNGIDGMLAPSGDAAAFSAALDQLMSDPELRASLGRRAPEVIERFSIPSVMALWEQALGEVGVIEEPDATALTSKARDVVLDESRPTASV